MTPKEKAIELYNKFFTEVPFLQSDDDLRDDMNASKRCALIAVNEIDKELRKNLEPNLTKKYWLEVKNEIEKL
jgi:hypothetical protein